MNDFQKVIRYLFIVNLLRYPDMNYLDNIVLDALCFKTSHGTSLFMKSRVTEFLKEYTCCVVGGTSPTQSLIFGQCKDPLVL